MKALRSWPQLKKAFFLVFALGLMSCQSICDPGGTGGAAWTDEDVYIVVHAFIDGERTSYFNAWGWDSEDNFADDTPSGDQRAFLYFKVPGQIKVCAKLMASSILKQCETITAELGVPFVVKFYFTTPVTPGR